MIPKEVKELLEAAYYSGWSGGERYDSGFVDKDAFEEWWRSLDEGQILSAAMHLQAATLPTPPKLYPGTTVSFELEDFVVDHIDHDRDGRTTVSLKDKASYERDRQLANNLWGPP